MVVVVVVESGPAGSGGSTTGNTVSTSLATLLSGAGSIVCSGTPSRGCESDTVLAGETPATATETMFSTVPD